MKLLQRSGLLLLLLISQATWAQVSVRLAEPSISKPGAKGNGTVSFNTSQILMDNHTVNRQYLAPEGGLEVKNANATGTTGLIQVFPWTSTVRLKEAGFLVGFGQTNYRSGQDFRLLLYELHGTTDLKVVRTVASFPVTIPPEAVQKGKYLSFLFKESLPLEKGKQYALHLYPTQAKDQAIIFQLAETAYLGFSSLAVSQPLTLISNANRRPDLNIFLVAE
ncbi:hypothetical protein GCM10027275_51600 [Rhabdobacter roseus]|uniref:Uncharacterized protein n=1 Tax=Rhabdobacter roseus TaxID=1655419 RepID=A0A840TWD0_9BACT|nr:hypothetical protein [Rhabdobacter roseus]MBB5287235.1 hypothetical protein [Rhabdobacter roseus]